MARYLKPIIVFALLAPWCWLAYRVYLETLLVGSGLGADPVEGLIHYLGEWSLIVLLSAFSVTPLSRQFKWPMLIRSRRLIGVVAFVFVVTHTLVFAIFYAELQWQIFLREVIERPYITLGMASVIILALLTLTSTRGWQRRLGRRWKQLHRWVYLAVPLALLHLLWLRKDGYADVVIYSLWAAAMAAERMHHWRTGRRQKQSRQTKASVSM